MLIRKIFNARMEKKVDREKRLNRKEKIGRERIKHSKVNREGKRLDRFLEKQWWTIMNGNVNGDEEEEWTYTREQGESMIDYVIESNRTKEKIRNMVVGEKIELDHHQIIVSIEEKKERRGGQNRRKSKEVETGRKKGGWNLEKS